MTTYKRVRRPSPDGAPAYIIERDGVPVADVVKTGTHLDDYPWDWMILDPFAANARRSSGVSDTLRSAIDYVKAMVP